MHQVLKVNRGEIAVVLGSVCNALLCDLDHPHFPTQLRFEKADDHSNSQDDDYKLPILLVAQQTGVV